MWEALNQRLSFDAVVFMRGDWKCLPCFFTSFVRLIAFSIFHAVSAINSIGSVFLFNGLTLVLTFFTLSYFKFLLYTHWIPCPSTICCMAHTHTRTHHLKSIEICRSFVVVAVAVVPIVAFYTHHFHFQVLHFSCSENDEKKNERSNNGIDRSINQSLSGGRSFWGHES